MTDPTNTLPEPYQSGTLESCPFCGSPGYVYAKQGKSKGLYDVGCTKFGCLKMQQSFRSAEEATEAWNRRVKE